MYAQSTEEDAGCPALSLSTLFPWTESLSLILELGWWQEVPVILLSPLPCSARTTGTYIVIPNFHVDVGNLKPGAYVYTAIFRALQCGLLTPYSKAGNTPVDINLDSFIPGGNILMCPIHASHQPLFTFYFYPLSFVCLPFPLPWSKIRPRNFALRKSLDAHDAVCLWQPWEMLCIPLYGLLSDTSSLLPARAAFPTSVPCSCIAVWWNGHEYSWGT